MNPSSSKKLNDSAVVKVGKTVLKVGAALTALSIGYKRLNQYKLEMKSKGNIVRTVEDLRNQKGINFYVSAYDGVSFLKTNAKYSDKQIEKLAQAIENAPPQSISLIIFEDGCSENGRKRLLQALQKGPTIESLDIKFKFTDSTILLVKELVKNNKIQKLFFHDDEKNIFSFTDQLLYL